MSAPRDGTMALCAKCRRAIVCWRDIPLTAFEHDGQDIYMAGLPQVHWTHVRLPKVRHDAVPLPSVHDRVLVCTTCRVVLQANHQGWFCPNEHCPTRVDKD